MDDLQFYHQLQNERDELRDKIVEIEKAHSNELKAIVIEHEQRVNKILLKVTVKAKRLVIVTEKYEKLRTSIIDDNVDKGLLARKYVAAWHAGDDTYNLKQIAAKCSMSAQTIYDISHRMEKVT